MDQKLKNPEGENRFPSQRGFRAKKRVKGTIFIHHRKWAAEKHQSSFKKKMKAFLQLRMELKKTNSYRVY